MGGSIMSAHAHGETRPTKLYALFMGTADATATPDFVLYTAPRSEVVAGDIEGVRQTVEGTLLRSPEEARRFFQLFLFCLQGYEADPRELYQIDACRSWFQKIDKTHPSLIYFLPCHQYTLYVGSQQGNDGSMLSLSALWSFFQERDRALHALAQHIKEPYREVTKKLRRAFWEYFHLELKPW
jgi:hypothetical protein